MKHFTKLFSKFAFALIITLMSMSNVQAQFPATIMLDSKDPSIVNSPATVIGRSYTITVSGTYSMWPTNDSRGVDAAYLYNVPQVENDEIQTNCSVYWDMNKIAG